MTGNLLPEAEQRVDTVLRHGWDGDRLKARGIVDQYPDIGRENLCCAATVGDVGEVRRWLASDPTLANKTVGSLEWTPLTYVTYGRLDAQNATTIAGLLLEAGADPNFGFATDGAARSKCSRVPSGWAKAPNPRIRRP